MSVRIRVTIEYDWDPVWGEANQFDLERECQDWITGKITGHDLFVEDAAPEFKVERIAS